MSEPKSIPVTALKRLGSQPPVFDLPVTISTLAGVPAKFTLKCKALRKTEWARERDSRQREVLESLADDGAAEADAPAVPQDRIAAALANMAANGIEASVQTGLERDADSILVFATGWDLEDAFDRESLMALENEFGGALGACLRAYDVAIYQGVLGN